MKNRIIVALLALYVGMCTSLTVNAQSVEVWSRRVNFEFNITFVSDTTGQNIAFHAPLRSVKMSFGTVVYESYDYETMMLLIITPDPSRDPESNTVCITLGKRHYLIQPKDKLVIIRAEAEKLTFPDEWELVLN